MNIKSRSLFVTLLICLTLSLMVFAESYSDEGDHAGFCLQENRNKEVAKTIKERTGIDVEVEEGIIVYEPEKAKESLLARNKEVVKTIKERTGIDVEVEEGIVVYEPEKARKNDKPSIRAVSIPTTESPYYPYDTDWSGTINYSYSRYLFKFNTRLNSLSLTPYHIDFYGSDHSYLFTIYASKDPYREAYHQSVRMKKTDIGNIGANVNSYYITMYNDSKNSSSKKSQYSINEI